MIVYKLTDENACSLGNTHWTIGVMNTTDGNGGLCGSDWLHCYEHPLLAVLHDPIHGAFGESARMFRCEAGGQILKDDQMKMGCSELTPIEEIPLPTLTLIQRVAYAVYCAKCFQHDQRWNAWANNWISGEDRTFASAAEAAGWVATAAAEAAGWAARAAAAAAARAADAAARAADAAADVAEWSVRAAAADAAAWSVAKETNLISCAEKGVKIEK